MVNREEVMSPENKNAAFRLGCLCAVSAASFVILYLLWGRFNPGEVNRWLNPSIALLGLFVAYLSLPKLQDVRQTSCRGWVLAVLSLLIGVFGIILFGLGNEWLKGRSQGELILLVLVIWFLLAVAVVLIRYGQSLLRK